MQKTSNTQLEESELVESVIRYALAYGCYAARAGVPSAFMDAGAECISKLIATKISPEVRADIEIGIKMASIMEKEGIPNAAFRVLGKSILKRIATKAGINYSENDPSNESA